VIVDVEIKDVQSNEASDEISAMSYELRMLNSSATRRSSIKHRFDE
jgi:hypothetical protein